MPILSCPTPTISNDMFQSREAAEKSMYEETPFLKELFEDDNFDVKRIVTKNGKDVKLSQLETMRWFQKGFYSLSYFEGVWDFRHENPRFQKWSLKFKLR